MEISKRLSFILDNIDKVNVIADIGTDHGYIPIVAIKNDLCDKAIGSDINKDPLDKGKLNSVLEGVDEKTEFRLGSGLSTLKKGEVNAVIIAGMGGNLIRDLLEAEIEKVKELDYLILQPAQNPEVLREYLYVNGYDIIKEDLCKDEGIFYELFKVRKKDGESTTLEPIYYEVSPKLLLSKNPLMMEYLEEKIDMCRRIISFITDDSDNAITRKKDVEEKIAILENMKKFL